jgi:hypothetical protein
MALNRFLICLIANFVCFSFASPLHVRNTDALVQTVYHFSNETVSCEVFSPYVECDN